MKSHRCQPLFSCTQKPYISMTSLPVEPINRDTSERRLLRDGKQSALRQCQQFYNRSKNVSKRGGLIKLGR